jgi:hypothetical protein
MERTTLRQKAMPVKESDEILKKKMEQSSKHLMKLQKRKWNRVVNIYLISRHLVP